MRTAISGLGLLLTLSFAAPAHAAEIDWAKVDAALGKTASVQGEVHRYGIPAYRSAGDARRRCNQACFGARRMAWLRADARWCRWSWATSCSPRPRSIQS